MTAYSFEDAEAYEQFMGPWSGEVGKAFLAWLQPPTAAQWLDVGCGTGILTELICNSCAPASVTGVDAAEAQVARACRVRKLRQAQFRLGDAQALSFPDASFDVVVSALVMNFVPDRVRAMLEMRRVARPGGLIAACVWDFAAELSPSAPLRRAMRMMGIDPPPIPGTNASGLTMLADLFHQAGLNAVMATSFDVAVSFRNFDDFWASQTPSYAPTTKVIAALSRTDRQALIEAVRADLRPLPGGLGYSGQANAVKGHRPT
jgi:ubiquinone/menaquinone biosynthesis C-methylase UbiE